MVASVSINEELKEKLIIKSIELGVKQIDLVNRYVLEGLKKDSVFEKSAPTIEELEKLLKHDNPNGNHFKDIVGIVDTDEVIDEVEEKRSSWRG